VCGSLKKKLLQPKFSLPIYYACVLITDEQAVVSMRQSLYSKYEFFIEQAEEYSLFCSLIITIEYSLIW